MSDLLPQIDHIQQGLSRVISQYRNKPKWMILWACYLQQVQYVEDAVHAVVAIWRLDTATGWRLDVLGSLVGQPRIGTTDAIYRTYIQARIRANRSRGKIADLTGIADLLIPGYVYEDTLGVTGGDVRFFINPEYSATRQAELRAVLEMLQFAAPAGVHVWLDWAPSTDESNLSTYDFLFATAVEATEDEPNGFCDEATTHPPHAGSLAASANQ
jgi:hypothetical protein